MPKPLGFRDFINVDYTPGMPDLIKYQAVKRKRAQQGGGPDEETNTDEALSIAQRRKRAMQMRRLAPKIKMARKRAMRRTANKDAINKRARKQARMQLFRKFSKGKSPSDVSPQRRAEIEKRLDKMKSRIDRIAKRAIPDVRKRDRERRSSK